MVMGGNKGDTVANLDAAAIWMIEQAVTLLEQPPAGLDGLSVLPETLAAQWGVVLTAQPALNNERYLALFQIGRDGITHRIQTLHRAWDDGVLYELWQVTAGENGPTPQALFITTRCDDLEAVRQVRRASRHFPGAITSDAGKQLPLPLGNRRLLDDMRPWLFPDSFPASAIADGSGDPA
ncbi:hypothetical protein GE253_04560 [Niveispirillum sp. SYP-B3756]|uniref:hypothetical protein n=1 Tax=Niveispirillum sp. SYP-B3756 TaxID=2662178 RepID=UPI001290AC41|nr:hypothetical protein [Niveispirillum sp. SYP-B3756]MQP64613.1 hypothetical protein [Niveispirillum sp. SYP-B3756]